MRILIAVFILLISASLLHASCPNGVVKRREWRTLSKTDRERYIRALKTLKNTPAKGSTRSLYDTLVLIHYVYSGQVHSVANFLAWHRLFLWVLETLLRRIDPLVALPYWAWQFDSQAPELSEVFDDDPTSGFGGNGDMTNNWCINTGAFADWMVTTPETDAANPPNNVPPHCIRRHWDNTDRISAFYSTDNLQNMMVTSKKFITFAPALERVPHGQVHTAIGGEEGDLSMMYSPNDPLFFLHHGNLDKIWADWQALQGTTWDYEGMNYDGTKATWDDVLVGFRAKGATGPVPIQVKQVLDISNLCYEYVDFSLKAVDSALPQPTMRTSRLWRRQVQDKVTIRENVDVPASPHYCNRTMINVLLPPSDIPSSWAVKNGFNPAEVKDQEKKMKEKIALANSISDYVSLSCIWNHPTFLTKLVNTVPVLIVYTEKKELALKNTDGVQVPGDQASKLAQIASDYKSMFNAALAKYGKDHVIQRTPDPNRADIRSVLGDYMPGLKGMDGYAARAG